MPFMELAATDTLMPYRTHGGVLYVSKPSDQWKLSLQEVKLLYLKRQYKQCAARSAELIGKTDIQLHEIHKAFLCYYSAVCYEALGRAAHNYSTNKLPLLDMSRDNYVACKTYLTSALRDLHQGGRYEKQSGNGKLVALLQENGSIRHWPPALDRDQKLQTAGYVSRRVKTDSQGERWFQLDIDCKASAKHETPLLMPSPLRIRKDRPDLNHLASFFTTESLPSPRPLPEPPVEQQGQNGGRKSLPKSPNVCNLHELASPQEAEEEIQEENAEVPYSSESSRNQSPFRNADRREGEEKNKFYNDSSIASARLRHQIISLSSQLDSNVSTITSIILKTTELQRVHNATKNRRLASFWSFTPAASQHNSQYVSGDGFEDGGGSLSEESRHQRILRLRVEGWKTVGLRSKDRGWKGAEHYERICAEALAELYGR